MATTHASNRATLITPMDNGNFKNFGPAGTPQQVSTFVLQFQPSLDFVGSFQVFGRIGGVASSQPGIPAVGPAATLPIPYRKINVAGSASDYSLSIDPITSAGLIQVPCNGMQLHLLVTCTAGSCGVYSWDMQGPSAI